MAASFDDVATQRAFREAQKLPFPLLSDPDGSLAAKYGARLPDKPYAARVTFVVDEKGVLRHVDRRVNVDTHGRDLVEVVRRLRGA